MSSSNKGASGSSRRGAGGDKTTYKLMTYFSDDVKYAMDFQFDVSVPSLVESLKLLDVPIDTNSFLKPISSFDVNDASTGTLADFDGPIVDLISRNAYKNNDAKLDEFDESAVESLDPNAKRRNFKELMGLRAPTYTVVEFTAEELTEAGRAPTRAQHEIEADVIRQRGIVPAKIYTLEESFTRPLESFTHPLKPGVTAVESLPLLPDPSLWSSQVTPIIFDSDPILEDPQFSKSPGEYPPLILQPLTGRRQAQVHACVLYADAPLVRQSKGLPAASSADSLALHNADLDLIARSGGAQNVRVLPRLRAYQSIQDARTTAAAANATGGDGGANAAGGDGVSGGNVEQTLLFSLPNPRDASAPKVALISKLNHRVQLTKGNTDLQAASRALPEALAVVPAPAAAPVSFARPLTGGHATGAANRAPVSSSSMLHAPPVSSASQQLRSIEGDSDDDMGYIGGNAASTNSRPKMNLNDDEDDDEEVGGRLRAAGGRLRGGADDDEMF